ncbi:hypothetical protein J6590_087287, partial [Homalodisca vitripennis]
MWPLQHLATTDEDAFLRMTGWRSTYTADPTRERSLCLRTSVCEVESRREALYERIRSRHTSSI